MEKKNQIPKYPHLRFPEFTDEWKEVKLGEVAEILMCKRILASQTNTISGVPFFKIGTIGKTPDCYITRELFDEYKLRYSYPKKGQVLLTCSGTIGRCWIFSGEDAYFQDSNIVWIDNPEYVLLNRYLYYILINTDWSKLNSSTITRLYNDDLRRLKLRLPSLPEQRKIAALFSLIDERIEVQNAIIKEQEVLKASLLRRLFDRTLRFPEFADEWTEVKLGEVVICYSSTMTEEELQKEGGIPIYGAAGCCGYADVDEPFLESILIIKDGSGVGRSQYVTGPHYFLGTLNSLRTTSPTIFQKFVFYFLGQL
ncbi:hypothetical protein T235_02625, partial [Tannerella sp. oral taxon BU063 isolate Cell 8/11]